MGSLGVWAVAVATLLGTSGCWLAEGHKGSRRGSMDRASMSRTSSQEPHSMEGKADGNIDQSVYRGHVAAHVYMCNFSVNIYKMKVMYNSKLCLDTSCVDTDKASKLLLLLRLPCGASVRLAVNTEPLTQLLKGNLLCHLSYSCHK